MICIANFVEHVLLMSIGILTYVHSRSVVHQNCLLYNTDLWCPPIALETSRYIPPIALKISRRTIHTLLVNFVRRLYTFLILTGLISLRDSVSIVPLSFGSNTLMAPDALWPSCRCLLRLYLISTAIFCIWWFNNLSFFYFMWSPSSTSSLRHNGLTYWTLSFQEITGD